MSLYNPEEQQNNEGIYDIITKVHIIEAARSLGTTYDDLKRLVYIIIESTRDISRILAIR